MKHARPPTTPGPRVAWFSAAILAGTLLAYWPALSAGFIWDDDAHLTPPHLRSLDGLARIWTEPGATQQYYPLLHSVFWFEHRLWGDATLGYHLANILWHALATVLLGLLLARLALPGAWLGAALFALHPLHVESVAWISEQKNTLSAVCALGATLAWLRYDSTRSRAAWWGAWGVFVAGLATKTAIAPLPAALLVLAWWRRGRLELRRDVGPLLPWFALALVAGFFTAAVERHLIGADGRAFDLSVLQRLLLAGRIPWFYLKQLLWPAELVFIYPRWTIDPSAAGPWIILAGSVAFTLALWILRHRARGVWVAWLLFGGMLFPALGFFDVYPFRYSFVADHFAYLGAVPVLVLVAAFVGQWPRATVVWLAAFLLPALGLLTWRQAREYRDATTLYRATVAKNPSAWMAWNNLGKEVLADPAERAEALRCFERAVALHPDYFEARNNLGLTLTQSGRAAEARHHLERAVRLQPASYQAHNNLGIALAGSSRAAESLIAFRTAVALSPQLPNSRENFARALLLAGHPDEAAAQSAAAARLRAGLRP